MSAALKVVANHRVLEAPASAGEPSDTRFLGEMLVNDLHWSLMHVATLALAIDAAVNDSVRHPFRPWRALLNDDGKAGILALRFGRQLGLAPQALEKIQSYYQRSAAAKGQLKDKLENQSANTGLGDISPAMAQRTWRQLAADGRGLLTLISAMTAALAAEYGQDARAIDAFLADAATGGGRRFDDRGDIKIPALAQRRRTPRVAVDLPCEIVVGSRSFEASVLDVSREGFGVACEGGPSVGALAHIVLPDGRSLAGKVVRNTGGNLGLKLDVMLPMSDPLFGGRGQ